MITSDGGLVEIIGINGKSNYMYIRDQSFISMKTDLHQDINEGFAFSRWNISLKEVLR